MVRTDYGESHYIGPLDAGQAPEGTTWTDGHDHLAFLDMSQYFIQHYKTGKAPTITHDAVYFYYRCSSVSAVATADPLGRPRDADFSEDNVYASTFLAPDSPATHVEITGGSKGATTLPIPASGKGGVATYKAPFGEGQVRVRLLANGQELGSAVGKVPISNNIKTYNFSGSSPRGRTKRD